MLVRFFLIINYNIYSLRDPRLNDEARKYALFILENFPPPKTVTIQAMRERSENVHGKINETLIGTFKGIEEERQMKIDENTGKVEILYE